MHTVATIFILIWDAELYFGNKIEKKQVEQQGAEDGSGNK